MALEQAQEDVLAQAKANLESEGGAEQAGQDLSGLQTDEQSGSAQKFMEEPKKSLMEKIEPVLTILDLIAFSNLPQLLLNKYVQSEDKKKLPTTALSFYRDARREHNPLELTNGSF